MFKTMYAKRFVGVYLTLSEAAALPKMPYQVGSPRPAGAEYSYEYMITLDGKQTVGNMMGKSSSRPM